MQRLFSSFADGWPGAGLLLLRLLVGGALIYSGIAAVAAVHFELAAAEILGAIAGALLLVGLVTPVAAAVVAIVEAWVAFSHPGSPWIPLILAVLGVSLAMIGPGAWSVDARLFGRRQINLNL